LNKLRGGVADSHGRRAIAPRIERETNCKAASRHEDPLSASVFRNAVMYIMSTPSCWWLRHLRHHLHDIAILTASPPGTTNLGRSVAPFPNGIHKQKAPAACTFAPLRHMVARGLRITSTAGR
jgi:hypothetical protein